jgi:RNA polymerase sigma factor (sigma-70 family)
MVDVVRRVLAESTAGAHAGLTDSELLRRFATEKDDGAFAALFHRHTGMVLGVCRRSLPTHQDAEDACQATFLLLARKAAGGRWRPSVAPWLFSTARKVAANGRSAARRRALREGRAAVPAVIDTLDRMTARELLAALDEELDRLQPRYKELLVLCYLQDLSRGEAAERLGIPAATVKIRLARARERLAAALARRGCELGACLLALGVAANAGALSRNMTEGFLRSINGHPSTAVAALADGLGRTAAWPVALAATVAVVGVAAFGFGLEVESTRADSNTAEPPSTSASNGERPGIDAYGDPLPAGAVARLGTVRYRVGMWPFALTPSPDGRKLATIGRTSSQSDTLTIWDVATGRADRQVELADVLVQSVTWLPGGRGFAVVKVRKADYEVWEFTDPTARPPVAAEKSARNTITIGSFAVSAVSPDGTLLAAGQRAGAGGNEGRLDVWPVTRGDRVRNVSPRFGADTPGEFTGIAFTPDGRELVGLTRRRAAEGFGPRGEVLPGKLGETATVQVWSVATGKVRLAFDVPAGASAEPVQHLLMAADGRSLFAVSPAARVVEYDLGNGREKVAFEAADPRPKDANRRDVTHVALAPDGRTLLLVQRLTSIAGFDTRTGREKWRHSEKDATGIQSLAVLPDGKRFVMGTNADGRLRLGAIDSGRLGCSFTKTCSTSAWPGCTRLWTRPTRRPRRRPCS